MENKLLRSFYYACLGIKHAFVSERNMKIHGAVAVFVIAAAFYFNISHTEYLIILLTIAAVIGLEMTNTAIESLVNSMTKDHCPWAATAKNVAAGAVLFAAALAIVIGLVIFVPYIVQYW